MRHEEQAIRVILLYPRARKGIVLNIPSWRFWERMAVCFNHSRLVNSPFIWNVRIDSIHRECTVTCEHERQAKRLAEVLQLDFVNLPEVNDAA